MGVDIKGLYRVINYGFLLDIELYVQVFGRVGRDGEQFEVLLMYYGYQFCFCILVMFDYFKVEICCRLKIFGLFDDMNIGINGVVLKYFCCDICVKDCGCDEKVCYNNNGCMVFLMFKVIIFDLKFNGFK